MNDAYGVLLAFLLAVMVFLIGVVAGMPTKINEQCINDRGQVYCQVECFQKDGLLYCTKDESEIGK